MNSVVCPKFGHPVQSSDNYLSKQAPPPRLRDDFGNIFINTIAKKKKEKKNAISNLFTLSQNNNSLDD